MGLLPDRVLFERLSGALNTITHRSSVRDAKSRRFDLTPDGPDATLVTDTYDCTDSPEEVRKAVDNGKVWLGGMAKTLGRLGQLCATQ